MPTKRDIRQRASEIAKRLEYNYPGSNGELCALNHKGSFQLLVATILSAQCTDERVNMVTPGLFARFPDAKAMAQATLGELEELIRTTGFFRSKANHIWGMSKELLERFGGEVPPNMADLVTLPGVGRKTANVVLSVEFGRPGLPVDTHVGRLAGRLAITSNRDPVKIETDLNDLVSPDDRGVFSMRLILHGRAICKARSPQCGACFLSDICPSSNS